MFLLRDLDLDVITLRQGTATQAPPHSDGTITASRRYAQSAENRTGTRDLTGFLYPPNGPRNSRVMILTQR